MPSLSLAPPPSPTTSELDHAAAILHQTSLDLPAFTLPDGTLVSSRIDFKKPGLVQLSGAFDLPPSASAPEPAQFALAEQVIQRAFSTPCTFRRNHHVEVDPGGLKEGWVETTPYLWFETKRPSTRAERTAVRALLATQRIARHLLQGHQIHQLREQIATLQAHLRELTREWERQA